jgi:hypothetical protein
MKKLVAAFLILIVAVLAIPLFLLGNIKLALLNERTIKQLASDSSAIDIATTYIKESIITENDISLDDTATNEKLDQEVNPATVTPLINETIDQFFIALKSPEALEQNFEVKLGQVEQGDFSFNKIVVLEDNLPFVVVSSIDRLLLLLLFTIAGLLYLIFLLSSKSWAARLSWLGGTLIMLSLIVGAMYLFQNFFLTQYLDFLIAKSEFVRDPKLINGMRKLINGAVNRQALLYIGETVSLFIVGLAMVYLGKIALRPKDSDQPVNL